MTVYAPFYLSLLFLGGVTVHSDRASAIANSRAATACDALAAANFLEVVDAPTTIRRSRLVPSGGDVPAYCRVDGDLTPQIALELRLPAANWNGKFLALANVANGDVCGSYLKRGYACMPIFRTLKEGRPDAEWTALRRADLQARIDATLAPHLLTLAGKAITARFYSKSAERAYFKGCSAGGYSAMSEAQRFPADYDGIIAGAPNLNTADWLVRAIWDGRNAFDEDGKPVLNRRDLQILHRAVLNACDRDDGVEDGIVGNPPRCSVDVSALQCQADRGEACLTARKVAAIKRIYAGPAMRVPQLSAAVPNMFPGSELAWAMERTGGTVIQRLVAPHFDLAFDRTQPRLTPENFDFDRDYRRLGIASSVAVDNPDLRRFKAAGGKLIAYLGSDDTAYSGQIVDYYETVERTMGGRAATQEFFRFFVIPGMNHCWGGVGAHAVDYLSYLEAWVERSKAPDVLIGAHVAESVGAPEFPLDPKITIEFTRPIYPYPLYAKYSGRGDPNDAANFDAVDPTRSPQIVTDTAHH